MVEVAGTIPHDLDLADVNEVRRRVVSPVLDAMLHESELLSADLVVDFVWPVVEGGDAHWSNGWPFSPYVARPGDEPKSLYLVIRAIEDEQRTVWLGHLGFHRSSPFDVANHLIEAVGEWVVESRFGWGQVRSVHGSRGIPPMAAGPDGRRVVEIVPNRGGPPLLLNGTVISPITLGVDGDLEADLHSWAKRLASDVDALSALVQEELAAQQVALYGEQEEGAVTISMSTIQIETGKTEAAHARENAHLGRWRQLVDRHEPARDALVSRLRSALGPGYYVPTPPRIP